MSISLSEKSIKIKGLDRSCLKIILNENRKTGLALIQACTDDWQVEVPTDLFKTSFFI